MPDSFCITGGGGYLGYHIGKLLKSNGHRVVLFDRAKPPPIWKDNQDEDVLQGFDFVEGDVCNMDNLMDAFRGIDCVIHSASYGMSGLEQLKALWDRTEEVNIGGTKNVIQACCHQRVKALVYTSTYNVVFGGQEIPNGDETLPYFPLHKHGDHYSRTKSIAEQIILSVDGKALDGGGVLRTCALRLAGLMGPKEQRHIPRVMEYVKKGLVLFKYGLQDAVVDFISIHNAVQAHFLASTALLDPARMDVVRGQAYFINDGQPVANFEYFARIIEGLGYSAPKTRIPVSFALAIAFILECIPAFVRVRWNLYTVFTRTEVYKTAVTHCFSVEKARRHLGYEPTKPNDVTEIVDCLREQGYAKTVHSSQPQWINIRRISYVKNVIPSLVVVIVLFMVLLIVY